MYGLTLDHLDSFNIPGMAAGDIIVYHETIYLADRRRAGQGSITAYSRMGTPVRRFGGYVTVAPEELRRRVTQYRLRELRGDI